MAYNQDEKSVSDLMRFIIGGAYNRGGDGGGGGYNRDFTVYQVLLLIDYLNVLFLLVQPVLMITPPTWFILSLAMNVNFSMYEKYPIILIKDSIGIILVSGTLLHIPSVKF